MLFGKRGKSGLVALKLDFADVATFVKERLGKEVMLLFCAFKPFYRDHFDSISLFVSYVGRDEWMQRTHNNIHS
jgi:succinyl-CoA synthetase beta subunit